MGTDIDVELSRARDPARCFDAVRREFASAEARLSRFLPSSALARLNRGEPVADPVLALLVRLAIDAWRRTGGLFNPLVLPALEAAGYDRSFEFVQGGEPAPLVPPEPDRALFVRGDEVRLRAGRLDLGGLAKGWTAEHAARRVSPLARGVLVNAGGDLVACGAEDGGEGWVVAVEGPSGEVIWEGRWRGALATSSTVRRRWATSSGETAHHLIDPRTGLPAASEFVQVTVAAKSAVDAEVWSKAILIRGSEALGRSAQLEGVLAVRDDGSVLRAGVFRATSSGG